MNKHDFLLELKNQLREHKIADIDDIVAEYDEHFVRKATDGYTEEETAARLGSPREVAVQFAPRADGQAGRGLQRATLRVGLAFSDIFAGAFFILMWAWVFVLAAGAVASALCGLGLLLGPAAPALTAAVPMPYYGAAILAVALWALGLLLASTAVYCGALTLRLGKGYGRWHKNTTSDGRLPPVVIHPLLGEPLRRRLRTSTVAALAALGVSFVAGYVVLAISAGSPEFWHVWQWFN